MLPFILIISIIFLACLLFLFLRKRIRNKLLSEQENIVTKLTNRISSYFFADKTRQENIFDISLLIENKYSNEIIIQRQKKELTDCFCNMYEQIKHFIKRANSHKININPILFDFVKGFESTESVVLEHNNRVKKYILEENKNFFDNCLSYPLDYQQRLSVISEEENSLVVASAGSGKTSSVVGKIKYATQIKNTDPNKILLISYTHKAANELTERANIKDLQGYTFHKLALDIIAKNTKIKPSICENTDALFISVYRNLIKDKNFQKSVVDFFVYYDEETALWEENKKMRREALSNLKKQEIKAFLPDMDGNDIYVKSSEEKQICFALSCLGIRFRYEEAYQHDVADETHAQYKPDFSIYYNKNGKTHRLYLEHYALDKDDNVPPWFAQQNNIPYSQANERYKKSIAWKAETHQKYNTLLIHTRSSDFQTYEDIKDKIKELLQNYDIPFEEKNEQDIFQVIVPQNSKQEKTFIRLLSTFCTLLKSNCKNLDEVLQKSRANKDYRNHKAIKNIFSQVYVYYNSLLKEKNQIDFTDAILWATDILKHKQENLYDLIIVDEFQDISIDRYNFLLALRYGNPPAQLYCVGDDWQSIYRFSGSDMSLFKDFAYYFGYTDVNKIETTYRFGNPLVKLSSDFIQKNSSQIQKDIHPFKQINTEIEFVDYERKAYCETVLQIVNSLPKDKSVFLLGRYNFDDYYLSFMFEGYKKAEKYYYIIGSRHLEFMSVHKSKGLEADYVILLQCNDDVYGFPSKIERDSILNYLLNKSDNFPFAEERRLFYVAITRAKLKTIVMYDKRFPSRFVKEFIFPDSVEASCYTKHINANKRWTKQANNFLITLRKEGKSVKQISKKMGRSYTSIVMQMDKLGIK